MDGARVPTNVHPLSREGRLRAAGPDLLGPSPLARRLRALVQRCAADGSHVLIVAEPGLDPAAIAREIHARGRRARKPFVRLDCGAPDPGSVETELFGEGPLRRAARVGALEDVAADCRVAAARGGTLFLANVAELPAAAQARLARLVRDGEMRVGGAGRLEPFDVQLIAGAPPAIRTDVEENRFRSDLFRRLAVACVEVPPLRQRAEDIPAMVRHLAASTATAVRVRPKRFTDAALALLAALPWRGNTHELRAVIERLTLDEREPIIRVEHVLPHVRLDTESIPVRPNGNLREARRQFEREYIAAMLRRHGWRVGDAARALGIQRTNLYRKARQLGLALARSGR